MAMFRDHDAEKMQIILTTEVFVIYSYYTYSYYTYKKGGVPVAPCAGTSPPKPAATAWVTINCHVQCYECSSSYY